MTLVSVVVPTYNRNELLFTRALPSILRQTHWDLDVHVVADGMEGEQLAKYVILGNMLSDPRVSFWNIPRPTYPEDPGQKWNVLALWALNFGLDKARGEWVSVLADDDEWEPDFVETLLGAATEAGADFAYGMSRYHWPDGHPQTAGSWPPGHFQFCDGAYVYRNGMGYRYDPDCIFRGLPEDGDLWDRMVAGGVKFTFVPRVVHHYYVNPR